MKIVRAAAPSLVTIPNVELLEVGEDWETSTGSFSWTRRDLEAAIASQDDPGVRTPIVKLGHVDPRFDGQPSLGRIKNLRLTNNGQTLVGDLVGVPKWLGSVMASAYPKRSIEGGFDYTSRTGNTWPFVLTGVALLGDSYPAITTLDDIEALWGDTLPVMVPADELDGVAAGDQSGTFFRAVQAQAAPQGAEMKVNASTTVDDLRKKFYATQNKDQMFWWVREVRLDPLELIIDDDEGGLFRVPVTMDGDEASFGQAQPVRMEYVAATSRLVAASWNGPSQAGRPRKTQNSGANPTTVEGSSMKLSDAALRKLGLDPEAELTEEDIEAAVLALGESDDDDSDESAEGTEDDESEESEDDGAEDAESAEQGEPVAANIPEGFVLMDEATLADLQSGVAAARRIEQNQQETERRQFLENAVRAGKFPRARLKHYEQAWAADPQGTRELITKLSPGLVPISEQGSVAATLGGDAEEQNGYPAGWRGRVDATRRGASGRIKVVAD